MYGREHVLLIQGPPKTGTSTLNAMLNTHPEIINLFEVYMSQSQITKYGHQIIDKFPFSRAYFRDDTDYGDPLVDFFNHYSKLYPNYKYQFIGTKINSMKAGLTVKSYPYYTIYTYRDVRSWVIKQNVKKLFRTEIDIVNPIISFLTFVLNGYKHPNILRIWMEDMVLNNIETFTRIEEYLNIQFGEHSYKWWEKFGNYDQDELKGAFRLDHVHYSSHISPSQLDTQYVLADIPFWDDVNTIFDKYYLKNDFLDISQIDLDLNKIEQLRKYSPLGINEAYKEFHTERLGDPKSEAIEFNLSTLKNHKNPTVFRKVVRRLDRIAQAARGKTRLV